MPKAVPISNTAATEADFLRGKAQGEKFADCKRTTSNAAAHKVPLRSFGLRTFETRATPNKLSKAKCV